MKRILSALFCLSLVCAVIVWSIAANNPPENTVTFSGETVTKQLGFVGIPIASKVNTDVNGLITVTYQNPYTVTPNVQANIANGTANSRQYIRIYNNTAAGFTCQVYSFNTATVLGLDVLLGANVPVSGATVDFLITAMQ